MGAVIPPGLELSLWRSAVGGWRLTHSPLATEPPTGQRASAREPLASISCLFVDGDGRAGRLPARTGSRRRSSNLWPNAPRGSRAIRIYYVVQRPLQILG